MPRFFFTLHFEMKKQEDMKGNLVIVESPAKAGTIQKFLGKDYIVKSSFGHIRDLQDKKLSVDVENGFKPEYIVPADKKKVVSELKKLSSDAETVWLASDEDREGEAISWHLFDTLGLKKDNTRRIVFHEITKDAILNAIQNPRDIDMNLVEAQQARRVIDRLVGFELSPILWRKIQPKLSAGRVQSVALRLVVDREREIMAFKKEPYYHVDATFHPDGTSASTAVKAGLDARFGSLAEARKFLEDSKDARFTIENIEKKDGQRSPAAPFTTSTLQQEAARKLHFPVSKTMRVAQQLYERGLITYMRTDSTNLSTLALGTSKKFIIENYGEAYAHSRQFKTRSKGAQEAHEAIRPTYIENTSIEGTPDENKLYSLIWKRTVASQMADSKELRTTLKIGSDRRNEKFSALAVQVVFDGFLKLYREGTDDPQGEESVATLPEVSLGQVMEARSIDASCRFTTPPPRYSEATLVKRLEELGIGRPSTYAPTISTLTTGRGYILKGDKEGESIKVTNLNLAGGVIKETSKVETVGAEKGKLLPQEIGIIVTDYLVQNFGSIMDYDFTANVEKDFDKVAAGKKKWNGLIGEIYTPFHAKVDEVLNDRQFNHVSRELGLSPEGEPVVAKFGQYGPYVQKGEGEKRQFANLAPGQLIESITLAEALKLFELPRVVGLHEGKEVIATKGRFGPYIKYDGQNFSLPRKADPMTVTLEECIAAIGQTKDKPAANAVLKDYTESGIQILNGRYGPYIKKDGANYRIPKGVDAESLTEDKCKEIIAASEPTKSSFRKGKGRSSK